jgi:hypothetical protein
MSSRDDCPKPENPLSKRLDELGPCWLELLGCCRVVYMPVPLMVQRHDGELALGDVVARLRCSKCSRKPPFIALAQRPEPAREGWRIVLRNETRKD